MFKEKSISEKSDIAKEILALNNLKNKQDEQLALLITLFINQKFEINILLQQELYGLDISTGVMTQFAIKLANGKDGLSPDPANAFLLFEHTAHENGIAKFYLGYYHLTGKAEKKIDYDKALQLFNDAMQIDPSINIHLYKAIALRCKGMIYKALTELKLISKEMIDYDAARLEMDVIRRLQFEDNGDDSSDEEEIEENMEDYDIRTKYDEFSHSTVPAYIKEIDPKSYSFLSYILGVRLLYASEVNTFYYQKKRNLGKITLNCEPEKIDQWLSITLQETINKVLHLPLQINLTGRLAFKFLKDYSGEVQQLVVSSHTHLRILLRQSLKNLASPELEEYLAPLKEMLLETTADLQLEQYDPPPFFKLNDFHLSTRNFIENFYTQCGLLRANGRFACSNNWPRVRANNNLEKIMIKGAVEYSGRQDITFVKVELIKAVFGKLLALEMKRGDQSIIEYVENQYRCKHNINENTLRNSTISFLFDDTLLVRYLPYTDGRLKQELHHNITSDLQETFVDNLTKQKKSLAINLKRTTLPPQFTFVSENILEFQANLRLAMRVQRRRIFQAREDEEQMTISGEVFQAAWQFGLQKYLALENQEITSKGARNDLVINLETYARINEDLNNQRQKINKSLEKLKITSLDDSIIACWIRDILTTSTPKHCSFSATGEVLKFSKIPSKYQGAFLKLLLNLTYLLFGCEVQRNPASLICHQMMLDLIRSTNKDYHLSWTKALSDRENEKNFGGGAMPMSMGAYKKNDDKKASAHPVPSARVLQKHYGLFAVHAWRYDGEQASESITNKEHNTTRELIARERNLVERWLADKGLADKPIDEQIDAVEQQVSKWYSC